MSDSKEDPKAGLALSDGPVRNPDIAKIRKEQERGTSDDGCRIPYPGRI